MATPTASVRPQSVGNGLHAQGETWAEPCEEDRGRLIEIEAPAEEKDASKLQRTLPVAKWLGITAFQMVYVCVSTGMGVIVLPQEAERFHQPNSSMWVGVYMGISGSTQLICPVVGKLSDRHRSSWGRRRPFIATGSILAVLGLLLMRAASANLLPTLFVLALLGLQLAVNGVYAAQCGLPADFLDTVESSGSDKAVVSGLVAMYTFLGSLLSMTIVILTRNMPIQIHYLIYVATILVVSMLVCYCATEASSLNSTPGSLSLADIRRTYLIDPSKDADFAWVCAGRMCYYVSTSVAAFMYYYFRDMMHVETESRRRMVIGLLAIVMQCVGMLAAVPLGRLSNRWGRKPVIYISCMFMSCTFLLYVLAPLNAKTSWPAVVAAAVFYGIGSGAYLSVDYALALDCLPKGKTAAEALGLWGVIGFLGSTMGPVIGGVLLSFSQPAGADASQYPFSGYALLMLLLGCGMNLLLVVLTQQITGVR